MNVMTFREMFKYYDTPNIGEYQLCYLNILIVMNTNYKTKNYMIHWCVYFIV